MVKPRLETVLFICPVLAVKCASLAVSRYSVRTGELPACKSTSRKWPWCTSPVPGPCPTGSSTWPGGTSRGNRKSPIFSERWHAHRWSVAARSMAERGAPSRERRSARGTAALPGPNGPAHTCSSHYAKPSSRSTRPSKPSPALERHGGHTPAGVMVRILQRILALTAAIWHNDHTGAPVHRSLTAYDH
jgi:hypothetical protein